MSSERKMSSAKRRRRYCQMAVTFLALSISLQVTVFTRADDPMFQWPSRRAVDYLESTREGREESKSRRLKELHGNSSSKLDASNYQRDSESKRRLGSGWQYSARGGPVYRRRSSNAPPIDYGDGHPFQHYHPNREEETSASSNTYRAGQNRISKKNSRSDSLSNRRKIEFEAEWYDPLFSLDDFLQDEWYDIDDDFDPLQMKEDWFQTPANQTFNWDHFRPIRIRADTKNLPIDDSHQMKNKFIELTVIPAAIQFWTKALMVYPTKRLFVDNSHCTLGSPSDFWNGLTGVDLMIYVSAERFCDVEDSDQGGNFELFAGSESCDWDQYDRPIGGIIDFCYDSFLLDNNGTASNETAKVMVDVAIHEFGHILGLRSKDMAFYFDRHTGKPRTPRPVLASDDIHCVTGKYSRELPDSVYRPSPDTLRAGQLSSGGRFFEVVTPTVGQVARNHFNCSHMIGLRLENQPTGGDCYGDHWEERLAWDENMSPTVASKSIPEHLSPFTLALLEDTGWYRANFTMGKVMPFGHGSGCDFVSQPCIVNGSIPEYSKGYFCNSTNKATDFACDPSHSILAVCDLTDLSQYENEPFPPVPPVFSYFENNTFGPKRNKLADFCPIYDQIIFSCRKPLPEHYEHILTFPEEKFGVNSRCFNSNYDRPLCLETFCDEKSQMIKVILNGTETNCTYDGERIEIPQSPSFGGPFHFECPKFATLCPNSVCPANCAGKGICQWDSVPKKCSCFNESDSSESCYAFNISQIPLEKIIYYKDIPKDIPKDVPSPPKFAPILPTEMKPTPKPSSSAIEMPSISVKFHSPLFLGTFLFIYLL